MADRKQAREYSDEYRAYRRNKMRDVFGLTTFEYDCFRYYFGGDQSVDIAARAGVNTVEVGQATDRARAKIGANLDKRVLNRTKIKVEKLLGDLDDIEAYSTESYPKRHTTGGNSP